MPQINNPGADAAKSAGADAAKRTGKRTAKSAGKRAGKSTAKSTGKSAAKSTGKSAGKSATKGAVKSAAKGRTSAGKILVIVESPHKSGAIQKILGSRYIVDATIGHLRDLPKSRLGVDVEGNFEPEYINVRGKADKIKEIKNLAADAKAIYLATDPDREGEAISWHLCSLLGIDPAEASRVEFHEITKPAVEKAVKGLRPIDMNLVDAQQGRRVIDRLVGYEISPLLWEKIGKGLSAGRVQSAALKMVCDREREIKAFVPKEYWNLTVNLMKVGNPPSFTAKLEKYNGKKFEMGSKSACDKAASDLGLGSYEVISVKEKRDLKKPYPPFTTSTLMQDASHKLGFSPDKTRRLSQRLYEGVNLNGRGVIGLITYIRTDSVRVSSEADAACKAFVKKNYPKEYLGNNFYVNKNKGVQDAHEAIRPTDVNITPDDVGKSLEKGLALLYKLIWSRFVASRMSPAAYDSTVADIKNGGYSLKASSRRLAFDGYFKVYKDVSEGIRKPLPELSAGDALKELKKIPEKKFTEAPPKYTEASLIKDLEDRGIGRPSTYASILSTLEEKRYVKKEKKSLSATPLGMRITEDVMEVYFKEIVDSGFTAGMESALDSVAEGETSWREVVGGYYNSYVKDQVMKAGDELQKFRSEPVLTDELCPLCGKPLAIKEGRFGKFLACTGFPECRFSKSIVKSVGVKCPVCGGDIIVRRGKTGKIFYGCSNYPECRQVYWDLPVNKKCPKCGSLLVKRGKELVCSGEKCDYKEKASLEKSSRE